jgi:sterol desaturase/sphingolipid hydroxylase (fatty acid hydroxylase superfamily)
MAEFALSRRGYYADLLIAPAVALGALAMQCGWAALGVPLGFVSWSLFEYLTHRFVFHRVAWLKRGHDAHHQRPGEYIGAAPGVFVLPLAIFALVLWLMIGTGWSLAATLGFAAGYLLYLVGHDAMHHSRILPGSWLHEAMRRHVAHHAAGAETDYAIVFPFWDIVFRTRSAG